MVSYKYFNGDIFLDNEYKLQVHHEMNVPEKIHPIGIDYQIMTAGLKDKEVLNSMQLTSGEIENSNHLEILLDQSSLSRDCSVNNKNMLSGLTKLSQQIKCLEEENRRRTRKEFWIYTIWLGLATFEVTRYLLGNK